MGSNLGTIKIMEGRVITKKNGVTEIWSRGGGDPNNHIICKGITYRLLNGKDSEAESKKKYEEIEDDIDLLGHFDDFE